MLATGNGANGIGEREMSPGAFSFLLKKWQQASIKSICSSTKASVADERSLFMTHAAPESRKQVKKSKRIMAGPEDCECFTNI